MLNVHMPCADWRDLADAAMRRRKTSDAYA
jgi:hypothetical protein